MIIDLVREKQKRGIRLSPRECMHVMATTVINLPSTEELFKELHGTQDKSKSDSIENLEKNQESLDPEFSKVIDENYWKLI